MKQFNSDHISRLRNDYSLKSELTFVEYNVSSHTRLSVLRTERTLVLYLIDRTLIRDRRALAGGGNANLANLAPDLPGSFVRREAGCKSPSTKINVMRLNLDSWSEFPVAWVRRQNRGSAWGHGEFSLVKNARQCHDTSGWSAKRGDSSLVDARLHDNLWWTTQENLRYQRS